MIIRNAVLDDIQQLIPLIDQLGYPQTIDSIKERLQIYLSSDKYQILVAEINNSLVGFIAVSYNELFVFPHKRARIEALVVDHAFRRNGIGKNLVNSAEEHAKKQNCRTIDLTSGLKRSGSGTHDFYSSLGYNNDGERAKVYLRKSL